MSKRQSGFTLIELMIVVAIIGILAAIAIPTYTDYTARSQVSEAMNLLDGVKTPVAEFFADQGHYPEAASLDQLVGTLNGKYVAQMTITDGAGETANGFTNRFAVTALMKPAGQVAAGVGSSAMDMSTTSGGKRWSCTESTGTAIGAKYRPAACRP